MAKYVLSSRLSFAKSIILAEKYRSRSSPLLQTERRYATHKKKILLKMKIYLTNIISLLLTIYCCGQERKLSIIGNWKVISVSSDKEFYYNSTKDSLYVSKEMEELFVGKSKMFEEVNNTTRLAYKNCVHSFDNNGIHEEKSEVSSMKFKYTIDEENRKIKFFDFQNSTLICEMPYEINNNSLIYSVNLRSIGINVETKFTLEKLK